MVHTEHFYEPNNTFKTNVLSMKNSLERAINLSADIYINCSSSEVYSMKSWISGGVKESDPVLLSTAEQSLRASYATGKLLTEFFMMDAVEKGLIRGCSIRFANVYSDKEIYSKHIIPHIIESFTKSSQLILLENARKSMRTFLHNYDSCTAVISLINNKHSLDGSVYNVGTIEEIKILDLVDLIAKEVNINKYDIVFEGSRTADPTRRLLNIDKIINSTGWSPVINIEEGVKRCVKSF